MALTYAEQVALLDDALLAARVRQGMIDVAVEVMQATPNAAEPESVRLERHRRRTRYAVEVLRSPEHAANAMMKALVTLDGATAAPTDNAIRIGIASLWDAFSEVVLE